MKKNLFIFLFTFFSVCSLIAQTAVRGTVTDESGESLIGATVKIKGEKKSTITDLNGNFEIRVNNPDKDVLIISYIGLSEQTVEIKGKTSGLKIKLVAGANTLNEIVKVGYGTMRKKDLTGAVSTLSSNEIKDLPISSAMEALTGRIAGVYVQTTEGSPDATINIRVRGGGSITQDNSPLYIVDGFKVPSIANISPRDIQDYTVLRDASSTAIYGAEGANGVILITTKSGQKGRITVNLNSFFGYKLAYNLPKSLSPYEYVYYQREIDQSTTFSNMYGNWTDVDIYKSKKGDDWTNRLFNNFTTQQNHNLSISGGGENLRFNLSLTHDDQGFIMNNSGYKRDNVMFKVNGNISKSLTFDFMNRLANTVIDGPSVSGGGLLKSCVLFPPTKSLGQEADELTNGQDDASVETLVGSDLTNPVAGIQNDYKKQVQFDNTYNAGLTWTIFKDLSYRVQGSYAFKRNYTNEIWSQNTGLANANGGKPVANRAEITGNRYNVQNSLTYKHAFNSDNRFDIVLGQELNSQQDTKYVMQSKYYPKDMTASDILAMWGYGTPDPTYSTIAEPERTYSYFGRVNYQLKDRYLLTFTAREDGKSVFAPSQRWGFFPGMAAAWRISEESFLRNNPTISNLKLRLSYGEVGNGRVGSYWRQDWAFITSASKLSYFQESPSNSMQTSTVLYNEKLKWETKVSRNIGLDFGFFNEKINGTLDVYRESTKDLILKMPLPSNSGYLYQYQNVGQTSNRGLELTINADLINTRSLKLSANFNIAFNRNKVDKYSQPVQTIASGAPYSTSKYDYLVQEGKPVGQMYGYVVDGAYTFDDFFWSKKDSKWVLYNGVVSDQALLSTSGNNFGPGHIKLKDMNGDGIITEDDKAVIGNSQPKSTGGFGFNLRWKGFDVNTLFNWCYGNDIYNANKIVFNTYSGSKKYANLTTEFSLDRRFTTIDPVTGNNIMYGTYANPALLQQLNQGKVVWNPLINSTVPLSWAVEDGSFLRMSSLTVGYTLPERWTKSVFISNLRIYGTIYNVFCLTGYSGQDPEVSVYSNSLTPGVDYSAYPKARNFVIGANITF